MTYWRRIRQPGYLRYRCKVWAVRCAVALFGLPLAVVLAVGLPLYLGLLGLRKKRSEQRIMEKLATAAGGARR